MSVASVVDPMAPVKGVADVPAVPSVGSGIAAMPLPAGQPLTGDLSAMLTANLAAFTKGATPAQAPKPEPEETVVDVPEPEPKATATDPSPSSLLEELRPSKKPDAPAATAPTAQEPAPGPKELRKAYEATKAELKAIRDEKLALEARLKEVPQSTEELLKERKVREELEGKLSELDYRSSPQFKRDFIDPWQKTQEEVSKDISEFTNPEGEPLAFKDFEPLLRMTLPEATKAAKDLFGDNYLMAIDHRKRLLSHDKAAREALANHPQMRAKDQAQIQEAVAKTRMEFDTELNRISAELPEVFKPADEYRDLHARGQNEAMAALFGTGVQTPAERIKIAAVVAQKASAFTPTYRQLVAAKEKIASLEADIAKLRGTGPGNGSGAPTNGNGHDGPPAGSSIEDQLAYSIRKFSQKK